MARLKIATGPRYEKTGSRLQKQQRQIQQIADAIFAELHSGVRQRAKLRRPTFAPTLRPGQERRD